MVYHLILLRGSTMEKEILIQNFFRLLEFVKDDTYINNLISDLLSYLTDREQENFLAYTIDEVVENYDLQNIINS